jgi:hypothetical protein
MLVQHGTFSMPVKTVVSDCQYSDIPQTTETEPASRERRKRLRARVHWAISFFRLDNSDTVETVTQNLSSDGFYCRVNTVFVPGEVYPCILSVPTHYPYGGNQVQPVQCRVRVIRVEVLGAEDSYGVACRIEDYRFVGLEWPQQQVDSRDAAILPLSK